MNKLESLILDNVNKQKREGSYITPKREYPLKSLESEITNKLSTNNKIDS